ICLAFLPLFHTNAQSYSMLSTLWVGGTLVLQPKFSASRFWEVSLRNKCNWASMIPFCIKALVEQPLPDQHDYELWATAVRLTMAEEIFKVKTLGLWGMTETITHGIVADYNHLGPDMGIGRPSPGYDIAVRNDEGKIIEAGERGRLFIRGTRGVSLFKEYFKNEEATRSSFDEDGWFDTGDMVRMDENGDLFFADRDKDMLKVGAENVAASEIESIIMATGLVSECAVVGQKHFMLDEVPVAFVIPNAFADSTLAEKIMAACKENLPDFKVVRDIHIVDDLPRATLEKIAKNELRDRLPEITE
ncbi:MAG: AMP-binding protein, partial [Pseudomonadota bacterium]|nr:AMP-binding protein [Pseudomonadota bacterium]